MSRSPTYYNVILFNHNGYEISRIEAIEGTREAKKRACAMLTEEWAIMSETTHKDFGTAKVSVFLEDAPKQGYHDVCEWDKEHPQHAAWLAAQEEES